MIVPNAPTKPKPKIKRPTGTRFVLTASSTKVATTKGTGGVKVGSLVGKTGVLNAATKVGLIFTTGVNAGVGVGGAATKGNSPNFTTFT